MLGDLAKLPVYGYVGSEMGKALERHMDEKKKVRDEAIQNLKNFAFVVYDGKAPYVAAQNLAKYLESEGYESAAIDPEQYRSHLKGTLAEEKYSVPMTFGFRSKTRESQYDLLWLRCLSSMQMDIVAERLEARIGELPPPVY